MSLSNELISQFVKATAPKTQRSTESTSYGTILDSADNVIFVQLDGSDVATPVTSTVSVKSGERVIVQIKDHSATITGNLSDKAASGNAVDVLSGVVSVQQLSVEKLEADYANIRELYADKAYISELIAEYAKIKDLEVINATIENLDATYATIKTLDAEMARIDTLVAGKLTTESAVITELQAGVAEIDTLIFGSASGNTIHSNFANAVIAQLGDAQIKSAMIKDVSASKITAGDIITNNVRVMSEDGKMLISDETIQISDESRVRVQIGKDASDDYSINIWDANGKLMFSEGGITDSAIKNSIIRNDMISDNANISAGKLDISSLFTEINGSTETIKSTRIYLDDKGQTLDVVFKEMSDDVSSQGTAITVIQGKIDSKVWEQDFDAKTGSIYTKYSQLTQTVNGMSSTVADHTTKFSGFNGKVVDVSDKVTKLEQSVDGITTTVSRVESTEIGGRNLLLNSSFTGNLDKWNNVGFALTELNGQSCAHVTGGLGERYVIEQSFIDKIDPTNTEQVYTFSADVNIKNYVEGTTDPRVRLYFSAYYDNNGESTFFSPSTISGEPKFGPYNNKGWVRAVWTVQFKRVPTTLRAYIYAQDFTGDLYIKNLKLERGGKATDWTAAPEDVSSDIADVAGTASDAQTAADDAIGRIEIAESTIQQLADAINMLVVGEDGSTLLSQTDDGWKFNLSDITTGLSSAGNSIEDLINDLGGIEKTTESLQDAVENLGVMTDYVKIATYSGQPCIELGSTTSSFKLRITNTEIQFLEGTAKPAWLSNEKLYVETAEITDELQFGDFVFKMRSNGNMGLMWKGDN